MINKVILIGTVSSDISFKETATDKYVCRFRLQTTDGRFSEFHNCVAYDFSAKSCQNFSKGDIVSVEGSLRTKRYETEGVKKYFTSVVGHKLTIIGKNTIKETDEKVDVYEEKMYENEWGF